jgi:YD repeat-containing protein
MTSLPKMLPALLTFAMMTGAASAQSRTFYDASGNVVGRSATDSSGTVTNYDSPGRVIRCRPSASITGPVTGPLADKIKQCPSAQIPYARETSPILAC